ncbi:tetratricopeptide repeat protein, partial [Fulvivirga sp. RKSG066]|uniref:tetratricopeptide repeat protein n=1 Tax=Fulvivirga aurantia TaxID=2529383 RepID=UPI0012BD2ECE
MAKPAYDSLLEEVNLTEKEKIYSLVNLIYCIIKSGDTLRVDQRISELRNLLTQKNNDASKNADYLLLKGLISQSPDSIIFYTQSINKPLHGSSRLCFERGKAFYELMEIDSASSNLKHVLQSPMATNYLKFKSCYILADLSLVNRDFLNGLRYIDEALSISLIGNDERVDALKLKAKLKRKSGRIDESNALLDSLLVQQNFKNIQKLQLYEELAFNALAVDDTSKFHRILNILVEIPQHELITNRLKGSHYYRTQRFENAVFYYELVFNELQKQSSPDLVLVKEALFIIAESYQRLGDYNQAQNFAYKSLVFETPYRNSNFHWQHIFAPEVLNENYNFFNYNKLGSLYITAFLQEKDVSISDLKNTLQMYRIIDSVIFQQINVLEEDAVLAFLKIGHGVYSNAVHLCYILDSIQPNHYYKNLAFSFIEHSRGVVLIRDMLVNNDNRFKHIPEKFRSREVELKTAISSYKKDGHKGEVGLKSLLKQQEDYFYEMKQMYPDYYKARLRSEKFDLKELLNAADSSNEIFIQFLQTTDAIFRVTIRVDRVRFDRFPLNQELKNSLYMFLN